MVPTLQPGDRLVVVRRRRLRPGQLVALRDPRQPSRLLVKRVAALGAGTVTVLGDNPSESTDSRVFGPVQRSQIAGVVVYRYAPAPKRFPGGRT